ncbi:HlyD family secretion protein [Olivibacter sitiensis]|uniref:HlyD family secretion protein n=1 Tax=Olivibacter sitiensis TaxID=376470 RepID=UPI0004270EFF|nr:biotin/lipoyl-binding protein [Olivibacter sitiensis]
MKSYPYILLIVGQALLFAACQNHSEKSTEGKVKKEVISFAPKLTGRILKIYVQEGDLVRKGDTLALLDVPEVDAKLSQAQGAVMAASAQRDLTRHGATANQLKQLEAKQQGLQEQFNFAQKSYARAQAMFADSMMTPQAFDEATAKYLGAKAQLDAVNAELAEAQKGVRMETQTATQGQKDQALGALQEVQVALAEKCIIATSDMELETISLHEGELATAGFPLFNGYQPNTTYFRITIPESRIGQFKKGEQINVIVPYKQERYSGKIQSIKQLTRYADITAAYPNYQMEEAVYEIKIQPDDQRKASELLVNATLTLER